MPNIVINPFALRQTPDSRFSHWEFSEEELFGRILASLDDAVPGYRDGVILVPIDPDGVFSSTCELQPGDVLQGVYEARREGEAPRKAVYVVGGQKTPAKRVDVVLYSSATLAEDGTNTLPSEEGNWEVISVNARPTVEDVPISPGTLMYNHFHVAGSDDGGTSTGMTNDEFVAALEEGFRYWSNKASAAPKS